VFLYSYVPKESLHAMGMRLPRGRELFHGTNFRHAVEFSRSGRTPSRLSRAGQGQPELRYPVRGAGSNALLRPASHLVAAHGPVISGPRRVALGGSSDRLRSLLRRLPGGLAAAPCVEQGEH
jgi:hypothetical protein